MVLELSYNSEGKSRVLGLEGLHVHHFAWSLPGARSEKFAPATFTGGREVLALVTQTRPRLVSQQLARARLFMTQQALITSLCHWLT